MNRISVQVLLFFLCLTMESAIGDKAYKSQESQNPKENQRGSKRNVMHSELISNEEQHNFMPCLDCHKRKTLIQTSGANKIKSETRAVSLISQSDITESPTNKIVPNESERVEFSRKYNPDVTSNDDGFVPVPGPYGMKTRFSRTNALKPSSINPYKSESTPRNANSALRSHRDKSHSQRYSQNIERHQDAKRRSQYRVPKALDELSVKESIANENILGNGNFEIIRGGIYSDQDANEILGSRRMGRGFGSYVIPTYRQNRFHVVQNVQFPPYYQGRSQNPLQPLYYPRAPY